MKPIRAMRQKVANLVEVRALNRHHTVNGSFQPYREKADAKQKVTLHRGTEPIPELCQSRESTEVSI
jgi:hypothetical protein